MIDTIEEKKYQKFLKGTFLIKGWNARSREILEAAADKDRDEIDTLLSELGEKIGREWSKAADERKIDTLMLQNWGRELKEASGEGPEQLAARLRKLKKEVDSILSS